MKDRERDGGGGDNINIKMDVTKTVCEDGSGSCPMAVLKLLVLLQ
jgi:hypothetical protein